MYTMNGLIEKLCFDDTYFTLGRAVRIRKPGGVEYDGLLSKVEPHQLTVTYVHPEAGLEAELITVANVRFGNIAIRMLE